MKKTNQTIRFDERLIYDGSYHLSPRAYKAIFYIVSRYVDARETKLPEKIQVSLRELSRAIADGKGKSSENTLYRNIDGLCRELTESRIVFKSGVDIKGQDMNGYISWCSAAVPGICSGVKVIDFYFGQYMSQFLLGLSKYVRLHRSEVNRLTTGYAIRLFQILKGDRNKKEKYELKSRRVFELKQLRFVLGLDEKYQQFKELNRYVLQNALRQINEKTTVRITKLSFHRQQDVRRVSHVEFQFVNQVPKVPLGYLPKLKTLPDYTPTVEDIKQLSRSESEAYEILLDFGVKPGIAIRKIIPEIKGSESLGFEDYFIKSALDHFRRYSRNQKSKGLSAATFVQWWTVHKIFDISSDAWVKINERVSKAKKGLQQSNPESFENRIIARSMTRGEFVAWYKGQCMQKEKVNLEKITIKVQNHEL